MRTRVHACACAAPTLALTSLGALLLQGLLSRCEDSSLHHQCRWSAAERRRVEKRTHTEHQVRLNNYKTRWVFILHLGIPGTVPGGTALRHTRYCNRRYCT